METTTERMMATEITVRKMATYSSYRLLYAVNVYSSIFMNYKVVSRTLLALLNAML
jgi:hypothetical protein